MFEDARLSNGRHNPVRLSGPERSDRKSSEETEAKRILQHHTSNWKIELR